MLCYVIIYLAYKSYFRLYRGQSTVLELLSMYVLAVELRVCIHRVDDDMTCISRVALAV